MKRESTKKSADQIVAEFHDKHNRRDGGAGKGDSPRNVFSQDFQSNYDNINWEKPNSKKKYSQKVGHSGR